MSITQYDELIARKLPRQHAAGFVPDGQVNEKLFDWQQKLVLWALKLGRAALFEDCGLGKGPQQLEWAYHVGRHTGRPVLGLCPLAVADQMVSEGEKFGYRVKKCREASDFDPGFINYTNYERLHLFEHLIPELSGIVLDECFAPNTLVSVIENGIVKKKCIGKIRPNEIITNANGRDTVVECHRRRIGRAIKVSVAGDWITASENHPFFTQRGWVSALELAPGDYLMETAASMHLVSHGVLAETVIGLGPEILRNILLSEMENEAIQHSQMRPLSGSGEEKGNRQEQMVPCGKSPGYGGDRAYSESKSDDRSGRSDQSEPDIAGDEAQTFRAWRQWDRINDAAILAVGGTPKTMASGICLITGQENSGLSHLLQIGSRERREKNLHRGRWQLPPQPKGCGCQERRETGFARVDGIEVLELGHPELECWRNADGFVYFYDLKAARHPSYSVNGFLVHNSSILKDVSGATSQHLVEVFSKTPYRLCCTATPAPNDYEEFGMHAEFLGYGSRRDMLTTYFIHDSANTSEWRLKKHATKTFWRWVATWAACVSKPSDIGYPDDGFNLPPLNIETIEVQVDETEAAGGELFRMPSMSSTTMHKEMRITCATRAAKAAEIVAGHSGPVVVWCNTNYEADELAKLMPEAVEVRGSQSDDFKEAACNWFCGRILRSELDGGTDNGNKILISKPSMFGYGLNLQHCSKHVFVGLSYSFEEFYQAMRRSYRFGQKQPFTCTVIQAQTEGPIRKAILEKIERHNRMREEMKLAAESLSLDDGKRATVFKTDVHAESGEGWKLFHGDAVRVASGLKDESIDFSIYSPPFAALYVYSADPQDMGNCATDDEFIDQYRYLIKEKLRITKPGRLSAVHCADITAQLWKDGHIGLKDLTGLIIKAHTESGWHYHSRITIWKDPVVEMQRTKALGLLYKQLRKDSSRSRVGNPDYVIVFRKPGDNSEPITHTPDEYPLDTWQKDASPVWMDIRQTEVLNNEGAKEVNDERHIAPLQLDVVRRALRLWSNKGDVVYSPFTGIGTEGYCAVEMGRRFIGSELKASYYAQAIQWLKKATSEMSLL